MKHLYTLFALFLILWAPHLHAQIDTEERYVEIALYADVDAIVPGESFNLILEQNIVPDWHTYWRNPGDSGMATSFTPSVPDGFSVGGVMWPTPHQMPYGPLMNYGYADRVHFLIPVIAPASLSSETITLKLESEWLVCKDICIPEFGEASLTLPVNETSAPTNTALFNEALTKLPRSGASFGASVVDQGQTFDLHFNEPLSEPAYFFPHKWNVVKHAEAQIHTNERRTLRITKETNAPLTDETLSGILRVGDNGYKIDALYVKPMPQIIAATEEAKNIKETPISAQSTLIEENDITVWAALGLAFLGGLILNLMPCVFPVLSMKALSLIKLSEKKERYHAFLHGLSYTLGVVLSFGVIALALITLQNAGAQIGWGFQLQNPLIIAGLSYLLFIIGLNLSGYFEFAGGFANAGQKLTDGKGFSSSFFTGILATLVATPCTAPFMATALGFAITQPALISIGIFAMLGVGLAFPYLLLTIIPPLQRALPKPGAWMDIFKQFLAFPMFLSALWLAWVYMQQSSDMGVIFLLGGLTSLTFAIWILKSLSQNSARGFLIILAWLFITLAGLLAYLPQAPHVKMASSELWQPYSEEKLDQALASDKPVFINMTAAWCITCLANERVALSSDRIKAAFTDNDIIYLKGDWTNQDPEITKYLKSHGRSGVPIYVFYGQPSSDTNTRPEPKVLPQLLTEEILLEAIKH